MSKLKATLERLPISARQTLLNELQALNGHPAEKGRDDGDEALLAALLSLVKEQKPRRPRVVVTGAGAITPVGDTAPATWESLVAGRSGVGRVTQFDASPFPSQVGAELKDFDPTQRIPVKEARRMARCSQVAVSAAYEAVEDSRLDWAQVDRERAGVVIGTGLGGIDLYNEMIRRAERQQVVRARPMEAINGLPNMPAFHISLTFGCQGPLNTVVTACAAGTQAIGHAAEEIRRGAADVMLAGGVEALIIDIFYGGFSAMRAVTTRNDEPERASRPFDAERDGFVIGEGSAILVLESLEHALARGARIYAELLGWSETADAYHVAQPEPGGRGAAAAMRNAPGRRRPQPGRHQLYQRSRGRNAPGRRPRDKGHQGGFRAAGLRSADQLDQVDDRALLWRSRRHRSPGLHLFCL